MLYYIILYCIVLCIILYYIILYYIILYYIILCYITLYYIILYYLLTSVRSQSCFEKLYISVTVERIYLCGIFQYTVKPVFVAHLWFR
jgi:hypothetical protein